MKTVIFHRIFISLMIVILLAGCNMPTPERTRHSMDDSILMMYSAHRFILGENWTSEIEGGQKGNPSLRLQSTLEKINELRLLSQSYFDMADRMEGSSPQVVDYLRIKANNLNAQADRLEKRRNRGGIFRRIGRVLGNIISHTMDFTGRTVETIVENEIENRISEIVHIPRNIVKGHVLLVIEQLAQQRGGQLIRLLNGRTRQNIQRVAQLLQNIPETAQIGRNLANLPDISRDLDRGLNNIFSPMEGTLQAASNQLLNEGETGNSQQATPGNADDEDQSNSEFEAYQIENLNSDIRLLGHEICPPPQSGEYNDLILRGHPAGSTCAWEVGMETSKVNLSLAYEILERSDQTVNGKIYGNFSGEIHDSSDPKWFGSGQGSYQGKIESGEFTIRQSGADNFYQITGTGTITISISGDYEIYHVFNTTYGDMFSQLEPFTYEITLPAQFIWQNGTYPSFGIYVERLTQEEEAKLPMYMWFSFGLSENIPEP